MVVRMTTTRKAALIWYVGPPHGALLAAVALKSPAEANSADLFMVADMRDAGPGEQRLTGFRWAASCSLNPHLSRSVIKTESETLETRVQQHRNQQQSQIKI